MNIRSGQATIRRAIFAALGILSVALGIIGVFVPGLPTTVFVIAASYLFARSSPTLEAWLERNRWLGPSLQRFKETRGMPSRSKALALVSMWTGLGISIHALTAVGVVAQLFAFLLGLVGTATILFYVRTVSDIPGQTVNNPQVWVLLESVPQRLLTKRPTHVLHYGGGTLERVPRLVGTPRMLQKASEGKLRFPLLNWVSHGNGEVP
jgi:uncharacterized protein